MKTFILEEDIPVLCIKASSFPDGVKEAHERLHRLAPMDDGRKYFGISYPAGKGHLEYKAAATEAFKGELSKHLLEEFVIKKGNYLYIDIIDFMKNIPSIAEAFMKLIHDERIDPRTVCVEWYRNNEVCRCMVKTK